MTCAYVHDHQVCCASDGRRRSQLHKPTQWPRSLPCFHAVYVDADRAVPHAIHTPAQGNYDIPLQLPAGYEAALREALFFWEEYKLDHDTDVQVSGCNATQEISSKARDRLRSPSFSIPNLGPLRPAM